MRIDIYFDGACQNHADRNKSYHMGVGLYCEVDRVPYKGLAIFAGNGCWRSPQEHGTSNIAEWVGMCLAAQWSNRLLKEFPQRVVTIFSDSQLVTNQFNGNWMVKKRHLAPFLREAKKNLNAAVTNPVIWIKRDKNRVADDYSKKGLTFSDEMLVLKKDIHGVLYVDAPVLRNEQWEKAEEL